MKLRTSLRGTGKIVRRSLIALSRSFCNFHSTTKSQTLPFAVSCHLNLKINARITDDYLLSQNCNIFVVSGIFK